MIDLYKNNLQRRMTCLSAAIIATVQFCQLPSLAGNWQGLVQTGLNYAGRAATAAQRARAAHPGGTGTDSGGSGSSPSSETSVHAEIKQAPAAPTPAPVSTPTPVSVSPPPAAPSSESSNGSLYSKWYGGGRRASYSGSNSGGGEAGGGSNRGLQPGREAPVSMQQTRMARVHAKQLLQQQQRDLQQKKNVVVVRDTPDKSPEAPHVANVNLFQNNDKSDHKTAPPAKTAVDTSFLGPLFDHIKDRLKG